MPHATYRLQLSAAFTLDDAADLVPYLADLGVSHVFCSPILRATDGSTHGYDVVDHAVIGDEVGGDAGLESLSAAARRHGLGVMVDIVPNHMAVGMRANRQWWDVLRNGRGSPFAGWFDIDWDAGDGKVLAPILGGLLADEVAAGNVRVVAGPDGPELAYYDHRLPIDPQSWSADAGDVESGRIDLGGEGAAATAALLDAQHYRLADWHAAAEELNYRRFFDVDTLAGLRVEDPTVLAATHARILEWVADGNVDALRIDHPDGLRDPAGYLRRLHPATNGCWTVVEKILEPGEMLVPTWACDGTTGYDHMAMAGGLFVDPASKAPLEAGFGAFTGERRSYDEIVLAAKADVLADVLGADLRRVTACAVRVCSGDPRTSELLSGELVSGAVAALARNFDVYRAYVVAGPASPEDAAVIARAVSAARAEPGVATAIVDVLADALVADLPLSAEAADEFRARFQQFTGPLMAKSVEDTAFYRYVPLVSLNEVGSDPRHFGSTADAYHAHARHIAEHWPLSLNATSTHDTKRSEDVRARISLLSEMPDRWFTAVNGWRQLNAGAWHGATADPTMELLLYQVLVGAHPLPVDRAVAYMAKASREAKARTSWLAPNSGYDATLERFTAEVVDHPPFQESLVEFCEPLLVPGRIASLAMVVLKLMAPGVADIYQGCETWTDALVDPDNRRPVDYDGRRALLATVMAGHAGPAGPGVELADDRAGATKLWLTRTLLGLRARRPAAFAGPAATYRSLTASGAGAATVVAAQRGTDVISVVGTRPLAFVAAGWGDTTIELPTGRWTNLVDGTSAEGRARLADHAARYGATVFERVPAAGL